MKLKKAPGPALIDDRLLTSAEVCTLLRLNPKTLYRRRRDGQIVGIPINCRLYLYRESTIRKYLAMAEAGAFAPNAVTGAAR